MSLNLFVHFFVASPYLIVLQNPTIPFTHGTSPFGGNEGGGH